MLKFSLSNTNRKRKEKKSVDHTFFFQENDQRLLHLTTIFLRGFCFHIDIHSADLIVDQE